MTGSRLHYLLPLPVNPLIGLCSTFTSKPEVLNLQLYFHLFLCKGAAVTLHSLRLSRRIPVNMITFSSMAICIRSNYWNRFWIALMNSELGHMGGLCHENLMMVFEILTVMPSPCCMFLLELENDDHDHFTFCIFL